MKPDFKATNENAPAIAGICERVDGLPLAIEPAAARVKLFSPAALLGRLEKSLNPWIFGNILFGGLIGIVVDVASGSVNELKPDEVQSTFAAKVQSTGNSKALSLHVQMQRVTAARVQWMQQFFASGQRELGPPAMQE